MLENACWIKSHKDYGDVCPVFKRNFECRGKVARARLYITSLGVYEAVLNGKRVGNFIMAPGWTAYDKRHQYQTYDITELLQKENKLEVTVGKGWCRGRLVMYSFTNCYSGVSAMICRIDIEYENGEHEEIISDTNWKTAKSPVLFSEIYDGEVYDASYEPSEWEEAVRFHYTKLTLIPQEGEIVCEHERLAPVQMIKTPKGETVIDFGQNLTGYVEFKINAHTGERLCYSHAEILDADGSFYTENLRSAKQQIEYICREGEQTYKPHFTFMGFRYIRLEEAPADVKIDDFRAIAVYSDMKRTGHFSCSNSKVNKLFENIVWGQKDNFLDIPTDCPQRDERLGWTADAQIFVKTAAYNFDTEVFFRKWLRDLKADQLNDGRVPYVIPYVLDGTTQVTCAAWGDAAVIIPWQLYLTYGDKQVLEDHVESMRKWVEYIHASGTEEFLWIGNRHLGDWLDLENIQDEAEQIRHDDFIASAYFAYSTEILAKALKVIGRDGSEYERLHENIVAAFRKRFSEYKTQTECVLALEFGLAEDKEKTAAQLAEMIINNGVALKTGFIGTAYLLKSLSDNGYKTLSYRLLVKEDYPSWLYSVNKGATTVWEHWDGMRDDGQMWSKAMNSFNHYSFGAVASWMYEVVAGINVDESHPGFENVILKPEPDELLDFAEASIDTRYGRVSSKWYRKNGVVKYEFTVPNRATLFLNGEKYELSAGEYKF